MNRHRTKRMWICITVITSMTLYFTSSSQPRFPDLRASVLATNNKQKTRAPLHNITSTTVFVEPAKIPGTVPTTCRADLEYIEMYLDLQIGAQSTEFVTYAEGDGAKNFCGAPVTNSDFVISLGSNNDWSFEEAIGKDSHNVHTFDCTNSPNEWKPDFVKFYHQCVGIGFNYTFFHLATEVGFTAQDRVILKMDIESFEWDVIKEIVESPTAPDVMMIEVHIMQHSQCEKAQALNRWWGIVNEKYVLRNWRYNAVCPICIEVTYVKKSSEELALVPPVCEECRYQLRIFNTDLAKTISQLMLLILQVAQARDAYCLQNTLLFPDDRLMADYSWLLKYFHLESCSACQSTCDQQIRRHPPLRDPPVQPNTLLEFRKAPELFSNFLHEIRASPKNRLFKYCVLVDYRAPTPTPNWPTEIDIHVFALKSEDNSATSPFLTSPLCKDRKCFDESRGADTESLFVNLVTCEEVELVDTEMGMVVEACRSIV